MVAIEKLFEVSIRLSAERNPDKLLHLIIEQMNELLAADRLITNLTVSIGISTWQKDERQEVDAFLKKVNQALYRSKENGRNQVNVI